MDSVNWRADLITERVTLHAIHSITYDIHAYIARKDNRKENEQNAETSRELGILEA